MDSFASLARLYEELWMEARVAKLQICRDSTCSFPTNPHLLVDVVDVPLHRDNATAISYAWGEFDRQKRTVGHTTEPTNHVQFELGTEWVVSDVVDRLAELSEKKPIWMDQLCIPQEEDKILKTLADIPSIFCTLDVVVLFPGSHCGCVPNLVEKFSRLPSDGRDRQTEGEVLHLSRKQRPCLSSGASSWNRRMWTRQEFLHSQRVRCVWASKTENPCVVLDDPDINVENLPPFQKKMFETSTKNGLTQDQALQSVYRHLKITQFSMGLDLFPYVRTKDRLRDGQGWGRLFRFLLGEQLNKPPNSGTYLDLTLEFLWRLFSEVGLDRSNTRIHREATHPRDYVTSVWTACPKYIVPKEYKSMDVSELMQDALIQLQLYYQCTFAVTAPHGLFDGETFGSAVWQPQEYLSNIDISCDVDLYRPLAHEGFTIAAPRRLGDHIRVILHDSAQPSLSTSAMDYEMLVNHLHGMFPYENELSGNLSDSTLARKVIKLLHRTMSHWDRSRAKAFEYAFEKYTQELYTRPLNQQNALGNSNTGLWNRRIQPIIGYMSFLTNHWKEKDFDEKNSQELDYLIDSHESVQIHDVVYNMVAGALELDVDYCEKKNVKLIFSSIDNDERRPARVGFCRGDMDIEDIVSGRRKTITVSMGTSRSRPSTLLYEAVHLRDLEKESLCIPVYQVFAVWVPTKSIAEGEYGASVRQAHWKPSPRDKFGVLR